MLVRIFVLMVCGGGFKVRFGFLVVVYGGFGFYGGGF